MNTRRRQSTDPSKSPNSLLDKHNERQRLIRSYNEKGEWVSSTHVIERKVG